MANAAGLNSTSRDHGREFRVTPGEILYKAREQAGLGQREVSERLYLTQTYVNCIEHDEWDKLPGDTFVRGYLRSYARLLGLSEARIMDAYETMIGAGVNSHDRRRPRRERNGGAEGRNTAAVVQGVLVAVAVVLLVVGTLMSFLSKEGPEQRADAGTAADGAQQRGPDAATPDPAAMEPAQMDRVDAGDQSLPVAGERAAAPAEPAAPSPAAAQPAATPGGSGNALTRTAGSTATAVPADEDAGLLVIELAEECWTQVKDASGRVLTSRVHPAGARLEYRGAAPYAVIIGNAAAASVRYGGEPVDLGSHTSANVARLSLGE